MESVYEQNLLSNIQILLSLIEHFGPEGKLIAQLPKILTINVVQISMKNGRIESLTKPITIFKYENLFCKHTYCLLSFLRFVLN